MRTTVMDHTPRGMSPRQPLANARATLTLVLLVLAALALTLAAPAGAGDDPISVRAGLAPWEPIPSDALPPGDIRIGNRSFASFKTAAAALRPGDRLDIGPGTYRQPLVIRARGVHVVGHGHVVIERTSAQGKGAIITKADDIRISNIECRHIQVSDHNGACVRHEKRNLTLDHVYFHHAEQGVLSGPRPGKVVIIDSRFERLGKWGKAHGIYIGGGELLIQDSQFLASVSEGHEIKSRAKRTVIERTVVASLNGKDSRLIDVSNGGHLVVRDSVLEEGPASENYDMIGFALEKNPRETNSIELYNNIILIDSKHRTQLVYQRRGPPPVMEGNVIVGTPKDRYPGANTWYSDRAAAGFAPYPALPPLPAPR